MKKISKIFTATFILASSALASGPDTIGFGSRATAMGGAYSAIAEDYTALYYNIAGMGFSKDSTIGIGYSYSEPQFKYDNVEADIPLIRAINVGFSTPLGTGKISKTLSAGIALYDPTSYVIRVRNVDPRRRNFIMFENRANRISVFIGLSFKPLEVISLGIGAEVVGGLTVKTYLDPTKNIEPLTIDSPLPPVSAIGAGVMFRPYKFLSLALSYRGEISVPIELPAVISLFGEKVITMKTKFTDFSKPHEVSFGGAYFFSDILTVSAELTWHQFSKYIPPVPEIVEVEPPEFEAIVLELLGLPEDINPHFRDIFQFRFGTEFWLFPYLALRGGYSLRPSPVPSQKRESNYMDSTLHIFSFGTGLKFLDPWELLEKPVSIDAYFQLQWLSERRYHKESEVFGEDYSFSGRLFTFGIDITYRF